MIYFVKKLIRPALCLLVFLYSNKVVAQISSIQHLIDRLEGFKNFSYQSVNKRKDKGMDTTIALNKELFSKAINDKVFGNLYKIETNRTTETFHTIQIYNEKGLFILSPSDSTFFAETDAHSDYYESLIGKLKSLKEFYNKKPFKISMLRDTIVNGVAHSHLIANRYDKLENKEHLYANDDYYIDKQTGLPSLITIKARYELNGLLFDYYDEKKYFNFKIDRSDITEADFSIPKKFKPRIAQTTMALLDTMTSAPDFTLSDVNGKKVSLSQLRGNVVVLDFYFIGCGGCMVSIKPLNAIYEKYKNKGLIIASLTERDSKRAVLEFEKLHAIKYTGFINGSGVVKSYHVSFFPTFYLIDREGKIRNVLESCNDDFEEKLTSLLKTPLIKNKEKLD